MNYFIKQLLTVTILFFVLTAWPSECRAQEKKAILTLEAAIQEGIKNNTLISEAIENERAAVENEKSARASLFPSLSASYGYTRMKDVPFVVLGPAKVDVGKKDSISWDVTLTQPLFTGFALTTRRKIAAMGVDIQEIEKEQAVLDVAKQVKIAYFRILLARRATEVAEEEVKQLEGHANDAEQFYAQGIIPYNDLLKSQVALAQACQDKVRADSDLIVNISGLNTLIRRDIIENTNIEEIPPFQPSHYEISSLFEEAVQKRPELRLLNETLKQADLGVRLAKSSYYPRIYLNGRYEQTGDNMGATNNDFANDHNSSVTLQATWPFFESGKKHAEVRKATHQRAALKEKIQGVTDSILLEVRDAFQKLKVAETNIHTAREALVQAKENFRITNLQYKEGVTTSTEVLDAMTFLTQAEVNLYKALYGYRIAGAQLKRAVGKM